MTLSVKTSGCWRRGEAHGSGSGRTGEGGSRADRGGCPTGATKDEGLRQARGDLRGVDRCRVDHGAAVSRRHDARRLRQGQRLRVAVAIPLLAAPALVNRQEVFRGRRTTAVSVTIAQVIAQLAAFVGIVAGFWHITWIAGATFLAVGLVAVGVHSAGYWRVESPRERASSGP